MVEIQRGERWEEKKRLQMATSRARAKPQVMVTMKQMRMSRSMTRWGEEGRAGWVE